MDYIRLGTTGLQVSRLCLGCMSFGEAKRRWMLDEQQSRPILKKAFDAGINFFDTANMYGDGASERLTGKALLDMARRDEVVIATKVFYPMRPDPNGRGLSRKAIMTEVEASLRRLGTDYIDLYQVHRWDDATPIEETLEALHDVVKAGKARYIGASSMYAWQFCKALYVSRLNGWTRFVSMQPHYNLLYREEEREMLRLCQAEGIGVLPWSPLARGRLARLWASEPPTIRAQTDDTAVRLYGPMTAADKAVTERVGEISDKYGVALAQVALAWLLSNPAVTAPIVGVTKPEHLHDALAALDVRLADEDIAALEAPYVPRGMSGL